MELFRIKICGVTSPSAVAACAAAGADAIGLNCFPASKRYLDPAIAESVADSIPANVSRVGVFVNEQRDTVLRLADKLQLDIIQLHGDEDAEYAAQLAGYSYVRAFRFGSSGFAPVLEFLSATAALGCPPIGVLVDACVPGEFGGTGAQADWQRIVEEKRRLGPTKLILAGGLTPENVSDAIAAVRPFGVDTASGVEFEPGEKEPHLAREFVRLAKVALGV